MKTTITTFFFVCIAFLALAQRMGSSIVDAQGNHVFTSKLGFQDTVSTVGTYYINQQFLEGSVVMKSKQEIKGYKIRYNAKDAQLEFKTDVDIKLMPDNMFSSFSWVNALMTTETYINGDKYLWPDKTPVRGVFKVISEQNSISALHFTKFEFVKSNYMVALDMGVKENRIVKEDEYYIAIGKYLYKITSSTKKNLAIFGKYDKQVGDFVKKNNLTFKDPQSLEKIASFYASLGQG